MKRTRFFAALIAALLPAAFVPACSAPTGELVLVVQSDMELPKDVDTITIEVTSGGIPFLAQTY